MTSFSSDVANIIAEYLARYELRPWVKIDKLEWNWLSCNSLAMDLLRANPNHINWAFLSGCPHAIDMLLENPDKIRWNELSGNPAAID